MNRSHFPCCFQAFVRTFSKYFLLQSRASESSRVGACSAHPAAELFILPLPVNSEMPINEPFAFSLLFPSFRADFQQIFFASVPCVRIVARRRLCPPRRLNPISVNSKVPIKKIVSLPYVFQACARTCGNFFFLQSRGSELFRAGAGSAHLAADLFCEPPSC